MIKKKKKERWERKERNKFFLKRNYTLLNIQHNTATKTANRKRQEKRRL